MSDLVTSSEAASILGVASADAAGNVLRRAGYRAPHRQPGRGENLWHRADVEEYAANRHQGKRNDLKREEA